VVSWLDAFVEVHGVRVAVLGEEVTWNYGMVFFVLGGLVVFALWPVAA